ncbi:hypothetical protein [Kutzneria buriramensis]|uniref:Uncharacterized protein n=1 Tax=Kutzneria buriramensis TaxID=1045776 RepID=A0A3E0G884_9PSEU|nr:hypothetical protein [Kutzneria buriramensis]REH18064.1 hypothetical protein BCF44_13851 [Kutzneria buriramensis]
MIPVPMQQSTPLYQASTVECVWARTALNRAFCAPVAIDSWQLPHGMAVLPGLIGHPDAKGEISSFTVLLRTWLVAHPFGTLPVQCERQGIARSTAESFAAAVDAGHVDVQRDDEVGRWCQQWAQRHGVYMVPDWRTWS